ncbi:TerC family protein [Paenibacillus turpanensis]|uniref:TerC family protein n=1 Tax=Paenibacillus turpanensis TaxID=2689078 RepID=UPI001A9FBE27|nr:TerC family protein [Paenibacillus turpanensis]
MEFIVALLIIVGIDLVLAGDNAIVIALAARNLKKEQQKKVIFWGTFGAVAIRIVATLLVVYLLEVPGLHLVGGLLLLWIAYKLLIDDNDGHDVKAGSTVGAAIKTIIVADAAMGIDNVIAVAGASHGTELLVILGLLISVPLVVWGSTLFIKLVNRYGWIIYAGAGILAYTAAKMIVAEHFLTPFFANTYLKYGFEVIVIVAVLLLGRAANNKKQKEKGSEPVTASEVNL